MIKILLLVIALIAGLVVGPDLAGNQGYVLISAANQTIEMSVSTLVILVVFAFAALFILEWLIRKLFSLSSSTRGWFSGRKNKKARMLTNEGLLKLLEGDWKQSEKLLLKGVNHSDAPLLNYLAAAEAAQGRGDIDNRDRYLQQAADFGIDNLATALTRAKLQYRQGQYEEALASLQGLVDANPRNPVLLSLLKDTYLKLQDWQALLRLMPSLKRVKAVSEAEAERLELKAECGLMAHIATQKGSDGLLAHWNSLSRSARQQPKLIGCLVKQLIARKADSEAYIILRENLKKHPDESLISLVPELSLPDYHPAILKLQDVLRYNENNPVTHSALGQLYFREGKWAEARTHFEKALDIRPDVSDYAWLVDTLEKLNDPSAANHLSREALKLALPHKE
ncbi:tetratricopeptide repeat protein [Grimontia hollisae]|uniref:HemY-like protein n=2 Tax=Grimontia hollisae TaxID=673 RepID=D0I365_GRIHO|nr:heme biosynthesis HemY N-terminal domain-containing protein [Grimontia hollisae]AMG30676.1 tetratricopeptide repeat protein [Grimontia hollisae]EEY74107.1 HemY-like protein [Grimontia hollisae CIP 101886]MDF2184825.1 heme biosynthesis HemY N-terminal domain-containing protein [Grimontia hollisae]STO47659.1 putative protoheme IX biogenesis protein [Grimontia hollisae]STO58499.1 putative protoheme IX biogenesis protein [Grimontia hollisae]